MGNRVMVKVVVLVAAVLTVLATSGPVGAVPVNATSVLSQAQEVHWQIDVSPDLRHVAIIEPGEAASRLLLRSDSTETVIDSSSLFFGRVQVSDDGQTLVYTKRLAAETAVFRWRGGVATRLSAVGRDVNAAALSMSADGEVVGWTDRRTTSTVDSRVKVHRQGVVTEVGTGAGVFVASDGSYVQWQPSAETRQLDFASGVETTRSFFDLGVDSRTIARYAADEGFVDFSRVEIVDPAGSVVDELVFDELVFNIGFKAGPRLSANGRFVLYADNTSLKVWDRTTGSVDAVTGVSGQSIAISDDGRRIIVFRQGEVNEVLDVQLGRLGTPQAAVADLAGDPLDGQVVRLFEAYFDRLPDDEGRAFWRSQRAGGRSLASISDFFVVSPEFVATYGELDDGAFVDLVYQNVLGRAADPDGRVNWVSQLENGRSRGSVMVGFSESVEFIGATGTAPPSADEANEVWRLFLAYFDRDADQGGLDFWIEQRWNGRSLASISDFFAASAEFQQTYGELDNGEFVDLIYGNVLDRPADDEGRSFWVGRLDDGQSRGSVMVGFSESAEFVEVSGTLPD